MMSVIFNGWAGALMTLVSCLGKQKNKIHDDEIQKLLIDFKKAGQRNRNKQKIKMEKLCVPFRGS